MLRFQDAEGLDKDKAFWEWIGQVCWEFRQEVPLAEKVRDLVYRLEVDGKYGNLHIRTIGENSRVPAVYPILGEPLIVGLWNYNKVSSWYAIPSTWQLYYAKKEPFSTSYLLNNMNIHQYHLPLECKVTLGESLQEACEKVIRMSRNRLVGVTIRSIQRAQDAAADALIEALEEEYVP